MQWRMKYVVSTLCSVIMPLYQTMIMEKYHEMGGGLRWFVSDKTIGINRIVNNY